MNSCTLAARPDGCALAWGLHSREVFKCCGKTGLFVDVEMPHLGEKTRTPPRIGQCLIFWLMRFTIKKQINDGLG